MQGPDSFNTPPMLTLFQKKSKGIQKVKITFSQAKRILFFTTCKLIFIVFTPVVLLILPKDFFDNGKSICLSQLIFGFECPACGMTRGIMHLIHLDLENAFAYNMVSFIVLPLMIVVWIQWFFKETRIFRKLKVVLLSEPASENSCVN
jgi:hypothetical protein